MPNPFETIPQKEVGDIKKEQRLEIARDVLKDYTDLKAGDNILVLTNDAASKEMFSFFKELAEKNNINFEFYDVGDPNRDDSEKASSEIEEKVSKLSFAQDGVYDPENKDKDLLVVKICDLVPAVGKAYDEWIEKYQYRMLSIPGLSPSIFDEGGAITEDQETMEWRLNKMENELNKAEGFRITSAYGTDLTVGLRPSKERQWFKETGKLERGKWGNLPAGEIFTTPDEKNVNGVLMLPVLDSSVNTEQGVDEFVKVTVRDGVIVSIEGGESSKQLREYFQEQMKTDIKDGHSPWNTIRIAEIAFGANSKARSMVLDESKPYTSEGTSTVEGEKRLGTMHLAFGDAQHGEEGTDGFEASNSHLDFVLPRNGLSVEAFTTQEDVKSGKNGKYLIRDDNLNMGF